MSGPALWADDATTVYTAAAGAEDELPEYIRQQTALTVTLLLVNTRVAGFDVWGQ